MLETGRLAALGRESIAADRAGAQHRYMLLRGLALLGLAFALLTAARAGSALAAASVTVDPHDLGSGQSLHDNGFTYIVKRR